MLSEEGLATAMEGDEWKTAEDVLSEESLPEVPEAAEGWTLEEEGDPEENTVGKPDSIDELTLEEALLSDEMTPEANAALEEWALSDDSVLDEMEPEEPAAIDAEPADAWSMDESEPDLAAELEETSSEEERPLEELEADIAEELENIPIEEEEAGLPGKAEAVELPEPEKDSAGVESPVEEKRSEEASELDEWPAETEEVPGLDDDLLLDGWALDEDVLAGELNVKEDTEMDDILKETESALDDFLKESGNLEDDGAGEAEDLDLAADFGLGDQDVDDFELSGDDMAIGETMSEEDIDRLLGDDFALDEKGNDDEGLSALLESMGQDDDLSAISDLLEKADQGLTEDDDMLALLEESSAENTEDNDDAFDFWGKDESAGIRSGNIRENKEEGLDELVPKTEDKKKEKKKKEKKKKKAGSENGAEKPEKQGFFSRLMGALLEDDEDIDAALADGSAGELGSLSDENQDLLKELNAEDKKNAGKKAKKKKEPKKKAKEDKKPKKAPKPKKPKKEKKAKNVEPEEPGKRISRTKIVFVVIFCGSIAVAIIVVNKFIPDYMQKQQAREMYNSSQYEEVYELLYGKELNEEETALMQKSSVILQVKRKWNSYENYSKMNMPAEALNALFEGVEFYHLFSAEAQLCGVSGEVDGIYAKILAELSGNYGVSEEAALDVIASEDELTYSGKLYSILNGNGIGTPEEEEQPKVKEDVLPEEEEIIDRLKNTEASDGAEAVDQMDTTENADVPNDTDTTEAPEETSAEIQDVMPADDL